MTCTHRRKSSERYRCWRSDCPGCQKTYAVVAAKIAHDILGEHQDMRAVWWLPVAKGSYGRLQKLATRLWDNLRYHDKAPTKYLWFVTETADQIARVVVTAKEIPVEEIRRYWVERYGAPEPRVFTLDRKAIRRFIAGHCGKVSVDVDRRMGSATCLPGVSPRRNSPGRKTPDNEIAYAGQGGIDRV